MPVELTASQRRLAVGVGAFFNMYVREKFFELSKKYLACLGVVSTAGDLLTEPGDYPISVTATSKTDSTMTAEVTTTTTIEMKPPPPWDVNGDGTVNIQDLVLVAGEFGQSGESLKGDVNGDGTVNILDLVLVSSHFGEDV